MRRPFNPLLGATGLLVLVAALQACSNNNTAGVTPVGPGSPSPSPSPFQLLIPGSTANYSGTDTVTVTYASPGPSQMNGTVAYSTTETDTVNTTSGSAPAPYVVNRSITYTLNGSAPASGIEPQTRTISDYENVTTGSASTETLNLYQSNSTLKGIDVKSGGPYTSSVTTKYSPDTELAQYPLTAGTTWNATETRTVNTMTSDSTTSGSQTSNVTDTFQSDDSFTENGTLQNGDTTARVENSDGSATVADTGPKPRTETIALPTTTCGSGTGGSAYEIPVTINGTAYCAIDWYLAVPGGTAQPPSPLGYTKFTVVGAATSMPSGCSPTGSFTNINEYDASTLVVNVIAATIDTATTRYFDSNGLTLCRIQTGTTYNYDTKTGALTTTTTHSINVSLTSYSTVGTSSKFRSHK